MKKISLKEAQKLPKGMKVTLWTKIGLPGDVLPKMVTRYIRDTGHVEGDITCGGIIFTDEKPFWKHYFHEETLATEARYWRDYEDQWWLIDSEE